MAFGYTLSNQEAQSIAQLAWIGLVGVLVAFVLVAVLHIVSRELDPITHAMSEYVHSRYGILMTLVFVAMGSSLFALAVAFHQIAVSTQETVGSILLGAAGTAILLAGVFPTDNLALQEKTRRGAVHNLAGFLLSPLLVGAMLALATPWNHLGDNLTLQMLAQGSAAVDTVVMLVLMVVNSITLRFGGFGQRAFMGLVCGSLLLTSIRLLMLASASA